MPELFDLPLPRHATRTALPVLSLPVNGDGRLFGLVVSRCLYSPVFGGALGYLHHNALSVNYLPSVHSSQGDM